MDQATEGRANPKGIPCLYFALNAIPHSLKFDLRLVVLNIIGQFRTLRELRIVEVRTTDHKGFDICLEGELRRTTWVTAWTTY